MHHNIQLNYFFSLSTNNSMSQGRLSVVKVKIVTII